MSASTLFPEPTTPSTGPLANLEPHVVWLQRSTRPEAAAARRRVNAWYQDFPDPNGQLAAKLTSPRDEVYYGALDELYVHQGLRRLEPDVRYEEGGQGPNFRVYRDGHQVLAVEVLSLFLRPEWARQARRHDELTDRLNRTFRPQGYFLHVEVLVQDPRRNLPLKALTRAAGAFLEDLPEPQEATAAYQSGQPLPWRDVERDGSYVRFEALPMRPNAPALTNPDARIVGMGPVIGGPVDPLVDSLVVDSHERLKERLNAKRKKPYVLDPGVPYVLVVGNHDPFCNDLQLLMGIYGRDWEAVIGGRQPLWQDELKFRGFFGIDKGGEPPYHTRFSAAAVINGAVLFHHPRTMEWLVFDNPHARVRLPAGLLPTTHRFQALDRSRWGWQPPRPLP
jgi:hypothetical protein